MNEMRNSDAPKMTATPTEGDIGRCTGWISLLVLALAGTLLLPGVRATWHTGYGARWGYILARGWP